MRSFYLVAPIQPVPCRSIVVAQNFSNTDEPACFAFGLPVTDDLFHGVDYVHHFGFYINLSTELSPMKINKELFKPQYQLLTGKPFSRQLPDTFKELLAAQIDPDEFEINLEALLLTSQSLVAQETGLSTDFSV